MGTSEGRATQHDSVARARWRRQRVVGVDLWVEGRRGADQAVSAARSAAIATHLRLVAAMEEPPDEDPWRGSELGDLRLRFFARRDDVHVTDEAIWELLACLPSGLRWSRLAKLTELDGTPDYCPLPTL